MKKLILITFAVVVNSLFALQYEIEIFNNDMSLEVISADKQAKQLAHRLLKKELRARKIKEYTVTEEGETNRGYAISLYLLRKSFEQQKMVVESNDNLITISVTAYDAEKLAQKLLRRKANGSSFGEYEVISQSNSANTYTLTAQLSSRIPYASSTRSSLKMYWTEGASIFEDTILFQANINGKSLQKIGKVDGEEYIKFDIDAVDQKIYLGETSLHTPGTIKKANMDLSNIETVMSLDTEIHQLAVDHASNSIFFTAGDAGGQRYLYKSDLNGNNIEVWDHLGEVDGSLRIDAKNQHIYWAFHDTITRVNTDGSGKEIVYVDNSGTEVTVIHDFVVDSENQKLYFVSFEVPSDPAKYWVTSIRGLDMNTQQVTTVWEEEETELFYCELDETRQVLYFTSSTDELDYIKSINIDGSDLRIVLERDSIAEFKIR
ncbi:hypothetical protein [Candidatus Uabimicrobium amorphum]|uniref:DUF5050 domain-containing protein n=1 Tax=Uabimicrobium amorphum TaxID=2596890 RepID=A0A5S9F5Y2_UABAM|nr:hypothetical protein [Candidatus Uabimicrobium amorphum]BBM85752.1 hypothetical protein UABAM_04130 [Candidatus Uabimicrobium amorphum]